MGLRFNFSQLLIALLVTLSTFAMLPGRAEAQLFPIYSHDESFVDPEEKETWVAWPLFRTARTSDTMTVALHPLFSWHINDSTGEKNTHVLWPIFTSRYSPRGKKGVDERRNVLLPIYYSRHETVKEKNVFDRFLLPFYFEGRQETGGRYFVVFPFLWYAWNARLTVPFFPPRTQTFAAVWPLFGDFRGYWNRKRIFFLLWPLYVYSTEGRGDDKMELYSVLWPLFGVYKGPKVSGFRIWPFYSRVKKEGEFDRSYFLWPLGHHRTGVISDDNASTQTVTMFLPFYMKWRRPKVEFDMVFPFYGELRTKGRVSRGYALALFNQEWDYRKGTREDRLFWFLLRRKVPIKGWTEQEVDPDATLGGGFFPFYVNTYNDKKVDRRIVWPFYRYRWNKYPTYEFTREYFVPFYSYQKKTFANGNYNMSQFLFPFFNKNKSLTDEYNTKVFHLFWFSRSPGMARNWTPLWTVWEKHVNRRTGAKMIAWCQQLWRYERNASGAERKKFNFLFVDYESVKRPGEEEVGHTRLFWGLIGRHKDPDLKTEVLGIKF